eukprot:TRINITY_DN890_c0_g1_i1.p1 TRINITY_DN890_c0_g1~~TRINITY_DN890_c0_g1_i1.p1  ORF type:complete len:274 (+),score=84.89 TRINITY_DN890_c0_g1_i1:56-877(+)
MVGKRPEYEMAPQLYYDEERANNYHKNSRIKKIQREMTERAIELLDLDPEEGAQYILDIGCGSGHSGKILAEFGHFWVGTDISVDMLKTANDHCSGDLILSDMGNGLNFKAGTFDHAISISALQWLCNEDEKSHNARHRLMSFFNSLYGILKNGGRAVLQYYPDGAEQLELITGCALKAGFGGGNVVDFPNSTKAKKIYLVLYAGYQPQELPGAKSHEMPSKQQYKKDHKRSDDKIKKGSVEWKLKKKERRRVQGLSTKRDSKYTGKRRGPKF